MGGPEFYLQYSRFLKKDLFILCVSVLSAHMSAHCTDRHQKRVLDSFELALQIVVRYHVDAVN